MRCRRKAAAVICSAASSTSSIVVNRPNPTRMLDRAHGIVEADGEEDMRGLLVAAVQNPGQFESTTKQSETNSVDIVHTSFSFSSIFRTEVAMLQATARSSWLS